MKSTTYHVLEINEGVVDSHHCHIFALKSCPQHEPTNTTKTEPKEQLNSYDPLKNCINVTECIVYMFRAMTL